MAIHTTGEYQYGSAARKRVQQVEYITREEQDRRRRTEHVESQLTRPFLILMTIAIVCTAFLCINSISVSVSVNQRLNNIKTLQSEYSQLVEDNDALELSISPYLDYNYVYQVATEELGMQYAGPDQIITYDSVESEYVKQYDEIPE